MTVCIAMNTDNGMSSHPWCALALVEIREIVCRDSLTPLRRTAVYAPQHIRAPLSSTVHGLLLEDCHHMSTYVSGSAQQPFQLTVCFAFSDFAPPHCTLPHSLRIPRVLFFEPISRDCCISMPDSSVNASQTRGRSNRLLRFSVFLDAGGLRGTLTGLLSQQLASLADLSLRSLQRRCVDLPPASYLAEPSRILQSLLLRILLLSPGSAKLRLGIVPGT